MKYFAGLDVSLEWTSVCVVGGDGQIVREAKVPSEPDALAAFFAELGVDMTRICLEAGPLSQWLYDGLAEAGLPVVCAETRQLKAVLSTTLNKSDRNDARGIAQMVRVDMIRPVHVKTISSQHRRMLLTNRKFMLKQLCDAEGNIRGTLRNFVMKVGKVTRRRSGDGTNLPGHRRHSGSLRALSLGRRPLRPDAAQMAIRGDRSCRSDLQMRRCDDAVNAG